MESWGTAPAPEEGVTISSQEVSSSVISYGRGERCFCLGRSSTLEASLGGGQAADGLDDQCEGSGAGSCFE